MSRTTLRSALAATFAAVAALAFTQAAGAATPTLSATQLQGVKASLDQQWTKVPASVAGWYVDEQTHSVVVEVVRNDPAGLAFAKSGVGASSAVRTVSVDSGYQTFWNIRGGDAITTTAGARCSAGFNARSASGARYVIDAGHCGNLGGTWSGTGGTIGTVAASSFPTNDYSAIRVSYSSAVSGPWVNRYNGSTYTVTGAANAYVGMAVCRSGSTTGWHCGSVTATNATVCYSQGCVYQMIKTNVCAEPGDSGGSLVTNTGSRVSAVGLTSGGSGNCSSGGTTYFQPVTEPLSVYGLTLYTG